MISNLIVKQLQRSYKFSLPTAVVSEMVVMVTDSVAIETVTLVVVTMETLATF